MTKTWSSELEIVAKIEHLDDLINRRTEIEEAISEKLKALEKATLSAKRAMRCVNEKRIKDIDELNSRLIVSDSEDGDSNQDDEGRDAEGVQAPQERIGNLLP